MTTATFENVRRTTLVRAMTLSPMLPDGFVEISLHREVSAPVLEERLTVTLRGDEDAVNSIAWALAQAQE